MGLSKDALSFANTSYLLEAVQKKQQKDAEDNAVTAVDDFIPERVPIDRDDLTSWRRERLEAIRRMKIKSREYLEQGHGSVETLSEEKEVINTCNNHKRVICHFYHDEFPRCKILDRHLSTLAAKHLEVKFIRMLATNSPFFTAKLGMKVLPTVICTLDGGIIHVFTGFEEFKGDSITEHTLRAGLLKRGAITTECCENLDDACPSDESD